MLSARLVIAGVLLWCSGFVCADERWYQIEVIGFRYAHAAGADADAPAEMPDYGSAEPLAIRDPKAPPPATASPVAFQQLARNEKSLEGVYKQLARSGGYEPLIHVAWRQTADQQRNVFLTSEPAPAPGAPPPATNGARFDGMEGKILVRLGDAPRVELDVAGYDDGRPSRLKETRPVRLNELHYFDHPDLGMLVQITPYDPSAGAAPVEAAAPPLNPPAAPVAAPSPGKPAKPGRTKVPALVITPAKPPATAPSPPPSAPSGGTEDFGPGPSD
ncbi:MAG: hypothetical protein HY749_06780 [Gammaproteobacteria bacterium]|nr:hypothetical protein [Gammaproteobacteria bacterium]MBI5614804.1 hypothetical protein [Gammaproteobacteria bacterium]